MDKKLHEIVNEITEELLKELRQIADYQKSDAAAADPAFAGTAVDHWTELRVRTSIEQASERTRMAIQNVIGRME